MDMKISNKLVEDVVTEVVSSEAVPLVAALKNKKNVSEFKLAEAVKMEINITRNLLYKLFDNNLVTFTRKKDKKKGWYIYYWTFNLKRIKYLVNDLKKKKLERLNERLKREEANHFFACPKECIRLDFEQAMNFEFKCPECGSLIEQEDNNEKINIIKKEIKELEKEIVK